MTFRPLAFAALLALAAPLPAMAFDLGNLTNQLSGALGTAQAPAQQTAQPNQTGQGGGASSGR